MKLTKPTSVQPLPKNAKQVFKGVIFEVYQWEQNMFDGTTSTFEKVKRPDTVTVFPILDNGNILLTYQEQPGKKPFVAGAGGRVDPEETILDAAKRELLEETGYIADKFIQWKAVNPIAKMEWTVYVFLAKGLKKVSDLHLDPGEKIELMEVSFSKFLKLAMKNDFYEPEIYRDIVEAVMDKNKMVKLRKLFFGK